MKIVAITGSIGCGKTTIAGIIRKLGYVVYDVDKWCRRLYFEADFLEKIRQNFPKAYDGKVFNKRKLREVVFGNKAELKKLESLTHPFLKRKFLSKIHQLRGREVVFVDVALLFEMGWDKYCTDIIVADAPYEVQKQRVIKRDKISTKEFEEIVAVQMSNEERIVLSDYVINTDCPEGVLRSNIIKVIEEIEQSC